MGDPGPHPNQTQPRAHMVTFDPSGRWVVVTDLGLDRLYVYRLDTVTGELVANVPPYLQFERGRGPRHIAFHPNGRLAYLINELSAIMTVLTWAPEAGIPGNPGRVDPARRLDGQETVRASRCAPVRAVRLRLK